jgi:hypothetical protein
MAQQLVYTSAPRLLQAGRTGFGTVAMHAGIPSWLQSEIEGFSQFSRLPGLDPSRVILSHAVFGQGDRKHHVFSRIQDCGADYTGRTNHIAHHFIFTAAEIVQATKLGLTPVDVLAYLSQGFWKTSWSGEPTILQADEELAIVSIPKNTLSLPAAAYWGHLCPEHPEYAAVLAPGKISEACWLIYPIGWSESIVYALGESMLLHTNPWIVTFTNNLQPTDNEQLFAWRCIPSDSPLIEKATASVRPCIDLSDPSPFLCGVPHEFLEQARTGKKPLPKARTMEAPQPQINQFSANSSSQIEKLPSPAQPLSSTPRPRIPLTRTTIKPHKQKKPTALIATLAIASLLLIGGLVIAYNNNKFEEKKDKILKEWASVSKDSPFNNPDLRLNDQDLNSIESFIGYFKDKQWDQVEDVIKNLDKSSGNHNNINTSLQQTYQDKIKELRGEQYTELANASDFSQKDLERLSSLVQRSQEPKNEWKKAIELQNSSNTSDSSFKEEDLPMSVPKDKKASEKLFALYKKRIVKPPAEEPTNPPVVTATPIPTPAPEEINPQPSPNAVATGTKQPTIPNKDVPIYVFFKKPNDYGDLKPTGKYTEPENLDNITLLNIVDNFGPTQNNSRNSAQFNQQDCFGVLNNEDLKHIVVTGNQTISNLFILLANKKELIFEIKDKTFEFRNAFLSSINQLKDGEKFLQGETEKSAFTFTWELKVDDTGSGRMYDFLNSNGTISSDTKPIIKKEDINQKIKKCADNTKIQKDKFEGQGKLYKPDFQSPDKSLDDIIKEINEFKITKEKDSEEFVIKVKEIIKKSKPKYQTIAQLLDDDTKNADKFLKKFDEQRAKDNWNKFETNFKNEWTELKLPTSVWDESKLKEFYKIPNTANLKNELQPSYNDFITAKREEANIESLASRSTIPVKITIKWSALKTPEVSINLQIPDFPISTSETTGGKQ